MKPFAKYLTIIILILWTTTSYGQLDTLFQPAAQLRDSIHALSRSARQKFDSLKSARFSGVSDSLNYFRQKIDSISRGANEQLAGIQNAYTKELGEINGLQNKLRAKIDSLAQRALPTQELTSKLDSAQQRIVTLQQDVQIKVSELKEKTLGKINTVDLPPELKKEVSSIQSAIDKITPDQILKGVPSIPGTNGLQTTIPAIPQLSTPLSLTSPLSGTSIPQLPNTNLDIKSLQSPELPKLEDLKQMAKVSQATSKAGASMNTIKEIQSQPMDKLADNKLTGLKDVKDIQTRAQLEGVAPLQSEAALKAELKKKAQSVAKDHFSDKQQQLKAAMEKLSTYKKKYSQVSSMKDLKKDPPNPLREKAFFERVIPGVNFQILKKGDDILLDVNPYVGYRITRRVTAGAGWNQRLGYNWNNKSFNTAAQVYGPRLFGEYNLSKGFSPRLEVEMMNTLVPPVTVTHGDPNQRQWVAGAFAGIKKQYKIAGQLRGTASVMFRLFDPKRQSPYGDVINARFGFEYSFKKRHKKEENNK